MQELSLSIQQRIKKTKQVITNQMDSDLIRNLRQQQKIRCQKQSFILSMMRSNKLLSSNLKKIYIKHSHQLMKLLQPSFEIKLGNNCDEDFLNEFVHLYTQFFNYFENKFTFKTKIKSFLRPTNHNLIMDLIKYFVDFTRDYYVQTIFWKMKNNSKITQTSQLEQDIIMFHQENQENIPTKVKPFGSIHRNYSQITESADNSFSPRKKTDEAKKTQQIEQKKNNNNNYDILDVTLTPYAFNISKQNPPNIQSLKMKINQFFRDQKSRNSSIKQIYQDYCDQYHAKKNRVQSSLQNSPYLTRYLKSDPLNSKTVPYKILLSIQKNGFSVIIIQIDNKKPSKTSYLTTNKLPNTVNLSSPQNFSPIRTTQNSLSPLKINLRMSQGEDSTKNDYFLTSMKVLRVSQNFLPPLITANNLGFFKNQKDFKNQSLRQKRGLLPFSIKLKKMTEDLQQAIPFINELSNQNNVLVRSTSFKHQTIQREKKKMQVPNNKEIYSQDYIYSRQSSEKRSKRKQSQDPSLAYRLSSKKINIKKKLIAQTRKSYQQTKYGYGSNHSKQKNKQSQQKILEWLQKIKNLKQLERKKIFGMNY